METLTETGWIVFATVPPAVGLLGVIVVRGRFAKRRDWVGAAVFFGCLAVVAAMTIVALAANSQLWLAGGTNMSLMAVGATLDLGRARRVHLC